MGLVANLFQGEFAAKSESEPKNRIEACSISVVVTGLVCLYPVYCLCQDGLDTIWHTSVFVRTGSRDSISHHQFLSGLVGHSISYVPVCVRTGLSVYIAHA